MEAIFSEKRFMRAMIFSFCIHLTVGLLITINLKTRGPGLREFEFMEVSLVEGTKQDRGGQDLRSIAPVPKVQSAPETPKAPALPVRPIEKVETPKENKEIPLAKREVKVDKPKEESTQKTQRLLEDALSSLKDKVKKEEQERAHLAEAIKKLKATGIKGKETSKTLEAGTIPGTGGGLGGAPLAIDIYRAQITNLIWSNWNFPAGMYEDSRLFRLEAVVRIVVEKSGNLLEYKVVKRSNDAAFDTSIVRAVERSNPLPPLPDWYDKAREEIEVTFSVKDLIKSN